MKKRIMLGIATCLVFAAAVPAAAHHSYAMFDRTRTVKISGTVKSFEFTNPHSYVWVVVKNAKGGEDVWGIEGTGPNSLVRRGWTKNSLKPGDFVHVEVEPLRDGRTGGYMHKITREDGSPIGTPGRDGTDGIGFRGADDKL